MKTLLLVYNADADFWSVAKDAVIKVVNPSSYECNLCAISHGALGPRAEWRKFLDQIPIGKRSLHRDEFRVQYPQLRDIELPAVFIEEDGEPRLLVEAKRINGMTTIGDLISALEDSLAEIADSRKRNAEADS